MTEDEEALEWARQQWEERPPGPLTPDQDRAVSLFGKVAKHQVA